MTSLKNKICGDKDCSTFKEAESLFRLAEIDLESIGFPEIKDRIELPENNPTLSYHVYFSNLNAELIQDKENRIYHKISGFYFTMAAVCTSDADGNYYPGMPNKYKFNIKNGKLNIKKIK